MCHVNTHGSSTATMQSKRSQFIERQQSASAALTTVPSSPMHKKLVNQLRPFRKVARSARINLNRYWGFLSQRYGHGSSGSNNPSKLMTTGTSSVLDQYATEMEQNRINEMLEAQACAISQNSLNSQYEEQYSLRSRSSVASSSLCQYEDCDCHLPVLMTVPKVQSPAPAPTISLPMALHQRFASLSSSCSSSASSAPAPSFTGYAYAHAPSTTAAELYYFNSSPRKLITMEDEDQFEFESASQYSMIL